MKTNFSKQRNHALTLMEVLFVIAFLAILAVMFLPALANRKHDSRFHCYNNLKQSGLAFNVWAGDNGDKYPMDVSVTNGGAMELAASGDSAVIFQVMSNELSTPKILICPMDKEHQAATNTSFTLAAKNISYFVGLDASFNSPLTILSGDDNFEFSGRITKSGLQFISTNAMYYWSTDRHNRSGNILLTDGSVQSLKNSELLNQVCQTGLATNRLAIP